MNKFGTILLTILGTLGVVAGGTAIALSVPNVQNKLNISYNGETFVGTDNTTTENPIEVDDFASELEKQGYILVEYMNSESSTLVIQKKGSAINRLDTPTKEGYVFIGWSTTKDGTNMIANVESSCKLYPVFVEDYGGEFYLYTDSSGSYSFSNISEFEISNFNYMGNKYNMGVAGFSTSPSEINLTNEIDPESYYYAVYYCYETDKIYSLEDAEYLRILLDYGEEGFYEVIYHNADGTSTTGMLYLIQPESHCYINGLFYWVIGVSISPDSTTVVDMSELEDGGNYYCVYSDENAGEILSYNEMHALYEASLTNESI